jgi:3-methyladenine DNA glycosylase AlkD
MTSSQILQKLQKLADPEKLEFKRKKFGIVANNALGVYIRDLKEIAKEIGTNNELALELFDSGVYEGRLLCSKVFKPKDVTEALMEKWVVTFENWEVCDSFSMTLFARSPFALQKINEWSKRKPEFEKRAAFATMAAYCMADKKADNSVYEKFLPILIREATDERLYVKKAVNWALRSIGKRNPDLNKAAIATAIQISALVPPKALAGGQDNPSNRASQWIAKDAIRELTTEKVNILDYPRAIYRPDGKKK